MKNKKKTKKNNDTATKKKSPIKVKRIVDLDQDLSELQVSPVVDDVGAVVMRSVDDPGEVNQSKGIILKPRFDKETGVVTMVPEENK